MKASDREKASESVGGGVLMACERSEHTACLDFSLTGVNRRGRNFD